MSILNAKLNQFNIWLPDNFFYKEISSVWQPVINKLKLPYLSVEDFMNSNIQSISFPEISLPTVTQGQGQYIYAHRNGKELEPILDKTLTITFKLSEGFFSYWILFEQIEKYLKYSSEQENFWPSIFLSFLDHHGFEIISFQFKEITPISLSPFSLNYSTVGADFNTFNLTIRYNRYDITRKLKNT